MKHLVLSLPRSASTWYCHQLAHQHTAFNLEEIFHQKRTHKHHDAMRYCTSTQSNIVVKLFHEHHVQSPIPDLSDVLIAICDRVHILVRKDFNAQVRSMYVACETNNWHQNFHETLNLDFKAQVYQEILNDLKHDIAWLAAIHQKTPHAHVCFTEDIVDYNPYHRPVTIQPELPCVSFEPHKYFS